MSQPSWVSKPFSEMSQTEWEMLCDGCAKCCLHKLEDQDTGEIFYTEVACELLDDHSCQCRDYDNRFSKVIDCLKLTPENLPEQRWLPSTCAYRLLLNGESLPHWHPLVSGDSQSVHNEGMSVRGRVLSEESVHEDDLEDHIIHWVE
ncbi:MAG: YcgN family cysteine cluster protein [Porticoccus sp.]